MPLPKHPQKYKDLQAWLAVFREAYAKGECSVHCGDPDAATNKRQRGYTLLKLLREEFADEYPDIFNMQMERSFTLSKDGPNIIVRCKVDPFIEAGKELQAKQHEETTGENLDDMVSRIMTELDGDTND